MRLNRFLALSGLGARRKVEGLILEGRIEVNGETVETLGVQVDPDRDRVVCDGQRLRIPRTYLYLAMNKPSGVVVSAGDERGRQTVYDLLSPRWRAKVRAVGRLDRASEGLLIFTNDGELAHGLMHPSHGVQRAYLAWVTPPPGREAVEQLRRGVPLGGGETSGPADVRVSGTRGGTARVRLTLREGKNREVRRMFRAVGARVLALRRVRIDGVYLGDLRAGSIRPLGQAEIASLQRAAGLVRGR